MAIKKKYILKKNWDIILLYIVVTSSLILSKTCSSGCQELACIVCLIPAYIGAFIVYFIAVTIIARTFIEKMKTTRLLWIIPSIIIIGLLLP